MRAIGVAVLGVAACIVATAAAGDGIPAPREVSATCQSCHGAGGNSANGDVPRLNGQQSAYLINRFHDFLDLTRSDPHAIKTMWGIVSNTNPAAFSEVAGYYASQTPTPAGTGAAHAVEGRALFLHGAQGVPACSACHGPDGEGSGTVPRLAGQHAKYLSDQLARLQLGLRETGTMHPVLRSISDAQIKALVAYLAKD